MRRLALLLLALGSALVPAAAASAHRPATDIERHAIIAAFTDDPSSCYSVRIADTAPGWALLTINEPRTEECKLLGNGFAVMHATNGVWTAVYQASEAGEPCAGLDQPIPSKIGVDLGACAAPVARSKTTVTCWGQLRKRGKNYVWPRKVRRKPKACNLPGKSNANAHILSRIRWKNWGKKVATATATSQAIHGQYVRGRLVFDKTRVRLRVSGIAEYGGKRWYTKLSVRSKYGTGRTGITVPWAKDPGDY